jgi:DNA-binding transcriptional regulator YdaS (Cro superfamily)
VSEWIEALRAECARTSQRRTAERLGVSTSMINQVLNGSYRADTSRLEARVRGELLAETVTCPVAGVITRRACQDHQAREFASTNPVRVALYRACRAGCPNSGLKEGQ